ncbi:hypothetical protein SNOG_03210 [Parastagonospora nodorum SN15]|uniref:Uncharacterized protein n=1 Tax=Phaeosphaeria nodorum (strain SN15 / ATCC MYA-4574 / FGSC 10173) TaxID=321614 RepID=Q0UYF4_PHANO|nr:hypothetical protein SNOG_03210 [Parastagonospora nodorum SN15]EAT89941.2 hypothetical protein SNOG_03210 [Parastagonospora nodorum SN15]
MTAHQQCMQYHFEKFPEAIRQKQKQGSLPKQQFFAPWISTVEEKWGYLAEIHEEKVSSEYAFMDASSRGILDTIFAIGGRSQLERIVQNGLHEKAAYMMSAKSQPLKRLERILRIMESFDIPDYKYLVSDTNVVVQAVNYCTGSPAQDLTDIESIYSILFPYTLCPPTIYLTIIRINHLRAETSSLFPNASHFLTAHDLLSLIESFSPEDWAQPGPHFDEWMLIGRTYQSAAALYCTMALQSLTILPSTLEMNAMRSVHGTQLLANLHQAPKTPRLTCFVMWPLTIAGVEAGYRDAVGAVAWNKWAIEESSGIEAVLGE